MGQESGGSSARRGENAQTGKPSAGSGADAGKPVSSRDEDLRHAANRIKLSLKAWSSPIGEAESSDDSVAAVAASTTKVHLAPADDERRKAVNLPALNKITIDMPHILSGHWAGDRSSVAGGDRNTAGKKDVFPPSMSPAQIEATIRAAYGVASRVQTQGDRVKLVGSANGLTIEMWLNLATKILESAYPKGR